MRGFITFTATWAYLGKSPWVPGTVGTAGAVPLVYLFAWAGQTAYLIAGLLLCVFAVWSASGYERYADTHDSREIVIDEVAGFIVAMAFLPLSWQTVLAGFLLFRLLDVIKPPPIGFLDAKIGGGLGVVVDDLVAGLFANLILRGGLHFFPALLGADYPG